MRLSYGGVSGGVMCLLQARPVFQAVSFPSMVVFQATPQDDVVTRWTLCPSMIGEPCPQLLLMVSDFIVFSH